MAERTEVVTDGQLSSTLVPGFTLRLADLGLEPLAEAAADAADAEEMR